MSFLRKDQLNKMGFKSIGNNVLISSKASLYNCANIIIGNNVRIDDFCVLSAGDHGIVIGDYIHIAVFSSLIGNGKIIINDYANISSRVSIYSSNDDYSGNYMTNPMIPKEFKNVTELDVYIGKHVIIGSGSVILPGIKIEKGVAIGALSLVNISCDEFSIYAGAPVKKIKERSRKLLDLEQKLTVG